MGGNFLSLGISPEPTQPTPIEFGEWLPDLVEMNNPGALEALNVLPVNGAYGPFPSAQHVGSAATSDLVRGAGAFFAPGDVIQVYAGTINGIYTGVSTLTQVFTAASLYDIYAWQFVQMGDQVVAIHPQQSLITATVGTLDAFTAVGGDPPTALCGDRVGNFLMVGNLTTDPDSGVPDAFPYRVRWSGFNNIDAPWVTDPATQSDYQDMPTEGGFVVGIVGRRQFGSIFQQRAISRVTYEGLPSVFSIDTIEDRRGPLSRDSIVSVGALDFFPAEDGFFMWNGTNTAPIGDNKVNTYFKNRLNYSTRDRIVGAVDYTHGCLLWAFPTDATGALNEIIIYSYKENKWTHSMQTVEALFTAGISSVTLDELTGDLDTDYPNSFDDVTYRGGQTLLACFNDQHQYCLYNGPNMAATIDTGEYSAPGGRRVQINNARPNVNLAFPIATMQVAGRDQLIGEPVIFGSAVAQEINGECPVLADARLVRFRTSIPFNAEWSHAVGVEVWRNSGGRV